MGKMVTLQHMSHTLPLRVEPFYDGLAVARHGVVSIDSGNINHLRAAYFRGYQKDDEGKWLKDFNDLDVYISRVTAESAGEEDVRKSSVRRRQSVT